MVHGSVTGWPATTTRSCGCWANMASVPAQQEKGAVSLTQLCHDGALCHQTKRFQIKQEKKYGLIRRTLTERGGGAHHIPIATNFTQSSCQSQKACWNAACSFTAQGPVRAPTCRRCDAVASETLRPTSRLLVCQHCCSASISCRSHPCIPAVHAGHFH